MNIKKSAFVLISVFLTCAFVTNTCEAQGKSIYVVASKNKNQSLQQAVNGFKQVVENTASRPAITYVDLENSALITEIRQASPSVIVTFGVEATRKVSGEVKNIPIVFSMILNPLKKGLVNSLKSSGNNLTGVSLDISASTQLKKVASILSFIKRVAIIYDPNISSGIVKSAQSASASLGLQIVAKPASSGKDVPASLESIKGQADAIWSIPDPTVYTSASIKHILLFSVRNKIPVIGFSEFFVKAGALLGLYSNYDDIGRQTGEITLKVMDGASPSGIPVAEPRKISIAFNRNVAGLFNINLDEATIKEFDKVY
ncbi:ABC transporter substrate-binding protein [Elusimicrobiota bacterium]